MKQVLVIVCLLCCFKGKAVDAGYAYRFYVNIETNQGEKYSGYIYHYYDYAFDEYIESIHHYLAKRATEKLSVYPNVISVNANRDNVDFAVKGTKIEIVFSKIAKVELVDALRFKVGERIIELSKKQYQLIKTSRAKYEVIEDVNLYENLKFILFTWDENKELSTLKEKIAPKIKAQWKRYIEIDLTHQEKFYTFMNSLKETLLKENILLIQFAEAL
jgi:hypothetical protein